jgi:hypothetical protein
MFRTKTVVQTTVLRQRQLCIQHFCLFSFPAAVASPDFYCPPSRKGNGDDTNTNTGINMGVPFSKPVFLLAGDLYPGYQTFKALETNDSNLMKQWLAYWVVRGTLRGTEWFGGAIKNMVPMYSWFKLVFFAWLVHPHYQGALQCYNSLVRPYLLKHEHDIDNAGQKLATEVTARVRRASKHTVDWLNVKKKQVGNRLVAEIKKAAVESIQEDNITSRRNNNWEEGEEEEDVSLVVD